MNSAIRNAVFALSLAWIKKVLQFLILQHSLLNEFLLVLVPQSDGIVCRVSLTVNHLNDSRSSPTILYFVREFSEVFLSVVDLELLAEAVVEQKLGEIELAWSRGSNHQYIQVVDFILDLHSLVDIVIISMSVVRQFPVPGVGLAFIITVELVSSPRLILDLPGLTLYLIILKKVLFDFGHIERVLGGSLRSFPFFQLFVLACVILVGFLKIFVALVQRLQNWEVALFSVLVHTRYVG